MNKKKFLVLLLSFVLVIALSAVGIVIAARRSAAKMPVTTIPVYDFESGSEVTTTAPTTTEKVKDDFTFSAEKLDGGTLDYSEFVCKKVIMINSWEPWCGPCVKEMPDIQRLYEKYKDKGFEVIGVCSRENAADARVIVSANSITYPVVFSDDPHFEILDTGYVPSTIFVDGTGHILSDKPDIGAQSFDAWERIITSYLY